MKPVYSFLCGVLLLFETDAYGQQNPKSPLYSISREGSHSVPNTPKEKIFKILGELPDSSSRIPIKPDGIVVEMDTTKGVLKMQHQYKCTNKADTIINGQMQKNAITKVTRNCYLVTYKISDNFFSYKISDFTDSQGKPLREANATPQKSEGCIESTVLTCRDKIVSKSIMMRIKNFGRRPPE